MADGSIYRVSLDIKADGTSAVRAVRKVADESTAAADTVDKNSKKVESANEEQGRSFDHVREGTSRLAGAVGSLMGTIGLGGLAFGIKDVVQAGEQWQEQQAQLVNALKNTHQYTAQTADMVRHSAETLSTHGGFAGPEEIAAMTQFIRLTGSATEAIKLNQAATNLARGSGGALGYAQAQQMVGQALTGNVGRLQKYLGIIQPVKTAEFALSQAHKVNIFQLELQSKALGKLGPLWLRNQEILHNITPVQMQQAQLTDRQRTAQEALTRIQERYGNSTQTFSRTTAGAISNLKNRFDLLGETVGRKVLPVVTSVVQFMAAHTTVLFDVAAAVGALTAAWAVNSAATTMIVGKWSIARVAGVLLSGTLTGVKTILSGLGIAFLDMGEEASTGWAMATLGIALMVPAVALIATHFKQFKAVVGAVWDWLKGAVSTVVGFVKSHWELLVDVLAGPFVALPLYVATHFAQVKRFASGLVTDIGRIFSTVLHAIEWPFTEAWKIIRGVFDGILKDVRWLVGQVTGVIGTILSPIKSIGHLLGGALGGAGHILGSLVPHFASGGFVGGYGGGDSVSAQLTPGEYVLRKETVQKVGVQSLNSINATGSLAGAGSSAGGPGALYITMPFTLKLPNGRILAEQTVHTSAKASALSGHYAVNL